MSLKWRFLCTLYKTSKSDSHKGWFTIYFLHVSDFPVSPLDAIESRMTGLGKIWLLIRCDGASLVAQMVKNPSAIPETQFNPWAGKIPWRKEWLPTSVFMGFPGGSDSKESACNVGDLDLIPGLGRSPERDSNPLQYSCLENPMGSQRVRHNWATKHTTACCANYLINF